MTTLDDDINKEFDKYSGDVRYFAEYQTKLEEIIKVLDTAAEIAKKMSHHEHADITVASFRQRWHNTHNISKKWVHAVNELVECWSQLEGKIDELTKWVDASKSS